MYCMYIELSNIIRVQHQWAAAAAQRLSHSCGDCQQSPCVRIRHRFFFSTHGGSVQIGSFHFPSSTLFFPRLCVVLVCCIQGMWGGLSCRTVKLKENLKRNENREWTVWGNCWLIRENTCIILSHHLQPSLQTLVLLTFSKCLAANMHSDALFSRVRRWSLRPIANSICLFAGLFSQLTQINTHGKLTRV